MSNHFTFLNLPPELRRHIYDLYFSSTRITIHPASIVIEPARARKMVPPPSRGRGVPHKDLAFFQVCRQIYREAEPCFYHSALFRVDIMVRRPFVPVEKLYAMRRVSGGAEVRQLLEMDEREAEGEDQDRGGGGARRRREDNDVQGTRRSGLYGSEGVRGRKKHCIVGPFEPDRMLIRELRVMPWVSDPILGFMVDEANMEGHKSVALDLYLSIYSPTVY